jgi:hypothetical protein
MMKKLNHQVEFFLVPAASVSDAPSFFFTPNFFPFFSPALDNLARIFINNKNYNEMYGGGKKGGK